MTLTSQVWAGIKKDLSVYKHHKKFLLNDYFSMLLWTLLSLYFAFFEPEEFDDSELYNPGIMFWTPAAAIMMKIAIERETKFSDFVRINGMGRVAYQIQIMIWSYFFMNIVTLIANSIHFKKAMIQKALETFFLTNFVNTSLILEISSFDFEIDLVEFTTLKSFLQLTFIFLCLGFCVVNLCLFFTTILKSKHAKIASLTSFIVITFFFQIFADDIILDPKEYEALRFQEKASSFFPGIGAQLIIVQFIKYYRNLAVISFLEEKEDLIKNSCVDSKDPAKCLEKFQSSKDIYQALSKSYCDNYQSCLFILLIGGFIFLALYLLFSNKDLLFSKKKRIAPQKQPLSLSLVNYQETKSTLAESLKEKLSCEEEERDFSQFESIIKVQNLTKTYGKFTALNSLNFSICEQEIFCLLGHNGAGKTTLINILSGLVTQTEGALFYNNQEVPPNAVYKVIGFCPQENILLDHNTVHENLLFFSRIKRILKDDIESQISFVMERLKLKPYKDTFVSKLSQEWKRKLNIAIALLNDPKILILDEPTSGLDMVSRRAFWDIVEDLKRAKKTVIFTTQFLDDAEELGDTIAVLSKGRLFAAGSVDFIKKKFGIGYTLIIHNKNNSENLSLQVPEISNKIMKEIPSAICYHEKNLNYIKYVLPHSERSKFAQVFAFLERMGDLNINLQMISLEEAFICLEKNSAVHIPKKSDSEKVEMISLKFENDFLMNQKKKISLFLDQIKMIVIQRFNRLNLKKGLFFPAILIIVSIVYSLTFGGVEIGELFSCWKNLSFIFHLVDLISMILLTGLISSDKKKKRNFIIRIMGLRSPLFWVGNLLTDFLLRLPLLIASITTIFLFSNTIASNYPYLVIGLFVTSSFNTTTYVYSLSKCFSESSTTMFFSLFCFLIESLRAFRIIVYVGISLIINSFPFFNSFYMFAIFDELEEPLLDDYSKNSIKLDIWILFLGALLHFAHVLIRDPKRFKLRNYKYVPNSSEIPSTLSDAETLAQEKDRLYSELNNDMIKVVEVQKVYPNGFKALHDLSFGIEKGQIFCLLGPNGAGKTTTFEVLLSKIPFDSGTVLLQGKTFSELLNSSLTIGICLESDTLWSVLSVEQHLRLYALIKGLTKTQTNESISYLYEALQLTEHTHKKVNELSGGIKRKLCVALAVLGEPDIVLLDEPTTGLDPIGRGQMWSLLKDLAKRKGTTVIVSTHFVEDAELVADKLGILVNGSIVTIGKMSELKKKYEDYFIVINGLAESHFAEVEKLIKTLLPLAKLDPSPDEKGILFRTPSKGMKFARLFQQLENLKSKDKIRDFAIYSTTLEHIFLRLARRQVAPQSLGQKKRQL